MTSSGPPPTRIVGYKIGRKMTQSEIPSTIPVKAKDAVGLLGYGNMQYIIPPGVDVLELGVIANAGQFILIPYDAYRKTLWDQTITLVVTKEQAYAQRRINARFYAALLVQLPHDAADLEAGVADNRERDERHPVFDLLRRAATEIWATERRSTKPLDDGERERLDVAVARRAAELLREEDSRCRLDRQSLHSLTERPSGCTWDRILWSVAQGDYDDAVVRVLARIKLNRRLNMPASCILQVLPGVQRLDIFGAVLGQSTEHPGQALQDWVEHRALGVDPEAAELAVRVLYAIWRMTEDAGVAKSIMRTHVQRIQHEPISADAGLIKLWLATVHKVDGSYDVPEGDVRLFDGMEEAIERWDRALVTTVEEVVMSLPERAVASPVSS
jgi:hypothetical protein